MSYTVLARRYRSASFSEVVGQEPIARTLANAIAAGRVAHAYLFTGTRGVGKTSMARIFARALNAPDTLPDAPKPDDGHKYPPLDVQQRMADAIMRGDDLNVIEIDGASNNSVDQARELIINASLSPTDNARYKIYIIDEVHMLSTAAFNALLKTMEEPPEHVKFILCTTESHKVLATIQSRCQRFDFRNISGARIAEHLKNVLKGEKIEAEEQVIWQIARLAAGSMRDSLSLLDRLIATLAPGENRVTIDLLEQMLGLPAGDTVAALIDALAAGDVAQSLGFSAALIDTGIAQDQLLEVLIDKLRELMIIAACGADSELVEMPEDAKPAATAQAGKFDPAGLAHMIALCENIQRFSKTSSNPRALLDAGIVRLALAEKMADVTALLSGSLPDQKKNEVMTTPVRSAPPAPVNRTDVRSPSTPTSSPVLPAVPVTTPVSLVTDDQLWAAVLAAVRDRPPLRWVQKLSLDALEDRVARVSLQSGHRELAGFVNSNKEQLARLMSQLAGRAIRVDISTSTSTGGTGVNDTTPPARATPSLPRRGMSDEQRRQVMALPLVRQVLDVFEASIVNVQDQAAIAPPAGPAQQPVSESRDEPQDIEDV